MHDVRQLIHCVFGRKLGTRKLEHKTLEGCEMQNLVMGVHFECCNI